MNKQNYISFMLILIVSQAVFQNQISAQNLRVSDNHHFLVKQDDTPLFWADLTWEEALDAPGSYQMQHLKNLMLSRPFLTRIPDQSINRSENITRCRSSTGLP